MSDHKYFISRQTYLSAFYLILQIFNSVSHCAWKWGYINRNATIYAYTG